jgi:hypothetical protein
MMRFRPAVSLIIVDGNAKYSELHGNSSYSLN